jgi:hypothetical protein
MNGGIFYQSLWTNICTHYPLHLVANVFHIIVWMELKFICICAKVQNWLTIKWAKNLVYIYTNHKLFWDWPGSNPTTWYEKNILFKDFMSNVGLSSHRSDTKDDPLVSNKEENQQDLLNSQLMTHQKFDLLSSIFLFDVRKCWEWLASNMGIQTPLCHSIMHHATNGPPSPPHIRYVHWAWNWTPPWIPHGCTCPNN